jgi:hypothetical protein
MSRRAGSCSSNAPVVPGGAVAHEDSGGTILGVELLKFASGLSRVIDILLAASAIVHLRQVGTHSRTHSTLNTAHNMHHTPHPCHQRPLTHTLTPNVQVPPTHGAYEAVTDLLGKVGGRPKKTFSGGTEVQRDCDEKDVKLIYMVPNERDDALAVECLQQTLRVERLEGVEVGGSRTRMCLSDRAQDNHTFAHNCTTGEKQTGVPARSADVRGNDDCADPAVSAPPPAISRRARWHQLERPR